MVSFKVHLTIQHYACRMKTSKLLSYALAFSLLSLVSCGGSSDSDITTGAGSSRTSLQQTLDAALDDEYKAHATYTAVINRFGSVHPFDNIRRAEQSHIHSLTILYADYDFALPSDPWAGQINSPDSIQAACQLGVTAEIENGALYDRLLQEAAPYQDVLKVFRALQAASINKHLPAFQRCS